MHRKYGYIIIDDNTKLTVYDLKVRYLKWAENRPYPGGTEYNCLYIMVDLKTFNSTKPGISEVLVGDERCQRIFCGLCHVDEPVRLKIFSSAGDPVQCLPDPDPGDQKTPDTGDPLNSR